MFVVGITHFRDTLFVFIRILFRPCVRMQCEEDDDRSLRNVLCVIPTYKENKKEVTATLDSLIAQEETNLVHRRVVMVCDGFLRFAEIFSSMILLESFKYKTYKQKLNQVSKTDNKQTPLFLISNLTFVCRHFSHGKPQPAVE